MLASASRKSINVLLVFALVVAVFFTPASSVQAATVYVTDTGSTIVVNTGSGLEYIINKTNGDLTFAKFNGTQLSGSGKASHIGPGLGSSANVTWSKSPSGSTVLITVTTSTLTHYYSSRGGENIIYMETYVTAQPSVGELRYIFRGNGNILTSVPANSNNRNNKGAIDGLLRM